jgi:hypothetical protein
MKVLLVAFLLAASSAMAAECKPDAQSGSASTPCETNDSRTHKQNVDAGTGSTRSRRPAPDADQSRQSSDEDAWTPTTNNMNYDTGEVCFARGANGLCLEEDD